MASKLLEWRCYSCISKAMPMRHATRHFSNSPIARQTENITHSGTTPPNDQDQSQLPPKERYLDPSLVHTARLERKIVRERQLQPIGSRRRRAALRESSEKSLPFDQLPYQCFQEARKVLAADRTEKLRLIEVQREKLGRLRETASGENWKNMDEVQRKFIQKRIKSMDMHIEELKIWADINDPTVKRRFEDGKGDLTKPVYRHLLHKKWSARDLLIDKQRISQFSIVPDIIQALPLPSVGIYLRFGSHNVQSGAYVSSSLSSDVSPTLTVQSFTSPQIPRLISIAAVSPDIPNVSKDGFDHKCHFLAMNLPLDATKPTYDLSKLSEQGKDVIFPWMPPFTQKGAPYQRITFIILEHPDAKQIDPVAAKKSMIDKERESDLDKLRQKWLLRSFIDRHHLKPIGALLFRNQFDEGTVKVMEGLGVPGRDVEFKRMKVEPLPYKKLKGERYR